MDSAVSCGIRLGRGALHAEILLFCLMIILSLQRNRLPLIVSLFFVQAFFSHSHL